MEPIDDFDRKILGLVQVDCQMKAEAIGDLVGLSASAVQRRLKRMRETGIITAEIAVVDRKAVGNPMTFIAGMEIERENYDALSKFRMWLAKQEPQWLPDEAVRKRWARGLIAGSLVLAIVIAWAKK